MSKLYRIGTPVSVTAQNGQNPLISLGSQHHDVQSLREILLAFNFQQYRCLEKDESLLTLVIQHRHVNVKHSQAWVRDILDACRSPSGYPAHTFGYTETIKTFSSTEGSMRVMSYTLLLGIKNPKRIHIVVTAAYL